MLEPMRVEGAALRPLPACARWSLRAAPTDLPRLAAVWGAALPDRMLTSASASGRHALRLGPDEHLLLADSAAAAEGFAALPREPPFALVDVGDRSVAAEASGPLAATLLNAGCPLDLSDAAFPPGACTRTVFGKAEIVLWRPGAEPLWRVEAWRSFADYVGRLLVQAATDLQP